MEAKFTKGEWVVQVTPDHYEPKSSTLEIHSPESSGWICKVQNNGVIKAVEGKANAKLIAAAPLMYKALKNIVVYEERGRAIGQPRIAERWYNECKEALKKQRSNNLNIMAISKKLRQQVYEKYNRKCAYTGFDLNEDWQVDHIKSKFLSEYHKHTSLEFNVNDISNLVPTLKIVNHYKRSLDLEQFRRYMTSFHLRLAKLPKTTRVPRTAKRVEYMKEVARVFGITPEKPFNGIFYFELINN